MIENLSTVEAVHSLWEHLAHDLRDIYDTHGVCAAVAQAVARATATQTVVGVSGPRDAYYDVWVSEADGSVVQRRWVRERASFDVLLATGKPVLQTKFDLPASRLLNSELWQLPRRAILSAPLPYPTDQTHYTPAGILCLVDPEENCTVNEQNIGALVTFISTYLDRAGLQSRSQQQAIEFATVHDISYSLTASLDLNNIFKQLSDQIRRTLNVEHLSIGLRDAASGEIVFANILMGPLFADLPPVRIRRGHGIVGWVAENAKPLIVNDVYQDSRFYAKVDKESGFQTHSILAVPLQVDQRVIGVIEAINKRHGDFNENDLRLLEAISAPLAVAIENANLHTDVLSEKRRIETLFRSMSEGLITVDANGIITETNDSLLTLLRLDQEAIIGRPVGDVIKPRKADFKGFLAQVMVAEDDYPQLACDIVAGTGEFVPVLVSGAKIENEDGKAREAIISFSDVSPIREVERMRDDFFHNIIHELRTPLATILMYARLLRKGRAKDDKEKEDRFLGVIERESDRLQAMVRKMLQLAKLETSDFQRSREEVDLNSIFEQILPPMGDLATEKGLIFVQRIQPGLPPVIGNHETIYLIVKNLVENAVKFTLSGKVRIDAQVKSEMIRIIVQDEGIGMNQEALPLLFRRFYRAQTATERGIAGTGLGLYMVKEGVEKHGGTIDVDTAEGKGTTFTISLPPARR